MATCNHTPPPRALPDALVDEVRTLVEIDHRRASIAVHVASDITRASRTATSLWLPPEKAEALARELLSAVQAWRSHESTVAWTVTGGRRNG